MKGGLITTDDELIKNVTQENKRQPLHWSTGVDVATRSRGFRL